MKKEYYWLLIILFTSLLITGINFGFDLYLDEEGYIRLYTTYFVIIPIVFEIIIFTILSYVCFGFIVALSKGINILRLWIFCISNVAVIILVSLLIKIQIELHGQCTVYPPLSALSEPTNNPKESTFYALWVILFIVTLTLFYSGYLLRKIKKLNTASNGN